MNACVPLTVAGPPVGAEDASMYFFARPHSVEPSCKASRPALLASASVSRSSSALALSVNRATAAPSRLDLDFLDQDRGHHARADVGHDHREHRQPELFTAHLSFPPLP